MDAELEKKLNSLIALTNAEGQPNANILWQVAKDIEFIKLNVKVFGYEVARALAQSLPVPGDTKPFKVGLGWRASTQADIASEWARHWLGELKIPRIFHRKIWEFAFILQILYENDCLMAGRKGLGFGCGVEPIPSYLASQGVNVTVTDLPPDHPARAGWAGTNQYTTDLFSSFLPHLVDRTVFEEKVSLKYVDMNDIPSELSDYDFCWSICALEHLGSIQKGLDFIVNSLTSLRIGGISVHTTEYNFMNSSHTLDNWGTVLFQKEHFEDLANRLRGLGHHVLPIDYSVGNDVMDKFIDLPPYSHDLSEVQHSIFGDHIAHLKVATDGFASTCFGIAVIKGK